MERARVLALLLICCGGVSQELDNALRLALRAAAGVMLENISQCTAVSHAAEKDRGIMDRRGPNADERPLKRLPGAAQSLPSGFLFCDAALEENEDYQRAMAEDLSDWSGEEV